LEGQIKAMETAFHMQKRAMQTFDISREPESVRQLYGETTFGRSCLLARRLVEDGVRVVTVYYTSDKDNQPWDTHSDHDERHRSRAPHLPLRRPRLPAHRRAWAGGAGDHRLRATNYSSRRLCRAAASRALQTCPVTMIGRVKFRLPSLDLGPNIRSCAFSNPTPFWSRWHWRLRSASPTANPP